MDDYFSPPEPVRASGPARSGPAPWARIGFLGIAAAALIAAAILAFGATATPKSILAAGSSNDGSTIVEDLNGMGGFGGRGGSGGPGFGELPHGAHLDRRGTPPPLGTIAKSSWTSAVWACSSWASS